MDVAAPRPLSSDRAAWRLSLVVFAAMLTRVDAAFAGRAYAAYGGIYIAASLGWLWFVEGQRPTAPDLLGALLAIGGAVMIVGAAAKRIL